MAEHDQLTGFPWFASLVEEQAGRAWFFALNCVLAGIWLGSGFWLDWSDAWNFSATTPTSITSWLILILLLHTGLRGTKALHLKLDGLIRANEAISNRLIGIENTNDPDRVSRWARENP